MRGVGKGGKDRAEAGKEGTLPAAGANFIQREKESGATSLGSDSSVCGNGSVSFVFQKHVGAVLAGFTGGISIRFGEWNLIFQRHNIFSFRGPDHCQTAPESTGDFESAGWRYADWPRRNLEGERCKKNATGRGESGVLYRAVPISNAGGRTLDVRIRISG